MASRSHTRRRPTQENCRLHVWQTKFNCSDCPAFSLSIVYLSADCEQSHRNVAKFDTPDPLDGIAQERAAKLLGVIFTGKLYKDHAEHCLHHLFT